MNTSLLLILILVTVAFVFLLLQGSRCNLFCTGPVENYGVSPGFDPSVRASIAGVGPMEALPDEYQYEEENECKVCA